MASDRPVREAENRLERFNADREKLLSEVERRVVARRIAASGALITAELVAFQLEEIVYEHIAQGGADSPERFGHQAK